MRVPNFACIGDHYHGLWSDNMKNGQGEMQYAEDHSVYTGEWVNNVVHGRGTFKDIKGEKRTNTALYRVVL